MKFHSLFKNIRPILLAGLFIATIGTQFTSHVVHAAPITDFNAGNIITDDVFYNKNAMSVSQIQNFLDSLITNCDVNGTQPSGYGNLTNAQYAQQIKGWPGPPYVCLNKYYENPSTGETSYEKGGGAFAGGISAAQIIYNSAQQYNINPQVLLVMLKKESLGPLTSDSWPLKSQYKYAMGYACPDSGPNYSANCDTAKAGFYKQMSLAAWQLNYYKEHPNDYRYHLGWNDIQYDTEPSCGTKRVYVQNMATLSLYIYTPYTPNDAALAAYPGQADCGAYGNRNFFQFFKEWFGVSVPAELSGRYSALGGELGPMGKALSAASCSPLRDSCHQQFQNGYIVFTTQTGAWESKGTIRSYWASIGFQSGIAGYPTGPESYDSATQTWSQSYQNGIISGRGNLGFWFTNSSINARWAALGGSRSGIGSPVAATVGSNTGISYQQFQNGYIISNPQTGAWESKGTIRTAWAKLGYQSGAAGYPTGPESYDPPSNSWYQTYQNGIIAGKDSTGFWFTNSNIYSRWSQLGGPNSGLGMPVESIVGNNTSVSHQGFQNGYIIYSPVFGAWESKGAIRDYWAKIGFQSGVAGYPTGPETYDANTQTWSQTYQNGTITYNAVSKGSFIKQ